jgi:predicted nucleotidyltransferase component of viral defense system
MKLHEDKTLFLQAVRAAAQQIKIPEIYIEKDYWVTYTLKTIYNHAIGKDTVFKGGTALSKCYNLIERFSEDIDLVVLRRESEPNNQLTKKIREISSVVGSVLPEIIIEGVTQKRGMNRKTAHTYAKEFEGNYGQVRDVIIVEATWLGSSEPFAEKTISSYIYEMMKTTGLLKIAEENELLPFNILVLDTKRTLCEKIMSLIRFSYTEEPLQDLKKKIRHTYDLYKLLQNKELAVFFQSDEFNELLLKVANDDVAGFKNNNDWLINHPIKSKMFAELETIWDNLKPTYNQDFKNLVFGAFPDDSEILDTLRSIKKRLSSIEWTITIEGKE